ncbi:hypothetical protein FQN54_005797 [Arachnomyces sp. PD_36]|nr:hypothetical protein FQN54_005797 [Arachnomyces sp. PD_36]
MNGSYRSSNSDYGDPRYLSSTSMGGIPPSNVLLDGYRNVLDSNNGNSRYNSINPTNNARTSHLLDVTDPVAMHLLAETAMGDSLAFEVLPYEEVESLKKEHSFYSNRIDALKRKLALETKLRDAAQSLSRLDGPKGRNGNVYEQGGGQYGQTDEELNASTRKCEDLAQEIWKNERKAQALQKRFLEHTAGVLQMTHKGLKKNLKQNENKDRNSGSVYGDSYGATNGMTEFDDRSLYKSAGYIDDMNGGYGSRGIEGQNGVVGVDLRSIQETEKKLEDLNSRMRQMILQVNPNQYLDPIPQTTGDGEPANRAAALQAHLAYLENSLNVMDSTQSQGPRGSTGSSYDTEERLEQINSQLRDILKDSASPHSQSPALTPPPGATGRLQAQLSYLSVGVDNFKRRVEGLTEQKDILKTQIQQQRELNSKSDAQRDAHILELSEEIESLKKELELSEREGQGTRDELSLVMEQLDASRQGAMLDEQDRSVSQAGKEALRQAEESSRAKDDEILRLEAEKNAIEEDSRAKDNEISRLEAEKDALQQVEANSHSKDNEISKLEASILQMRTESDQSIKEAMEAREQAEEEVKRLRAELSDLEGEAIRARTELTIAQAELDGAYGSRAERAAAVAANPAVRKELDELNERNATLVTENAALKAEQGNKSGSPQVQERVQTLERELRETIEDYEVMTKASIEFEKERDKLENVIDGLRDRCESLESQLNEEKIQWLNGPPSGGVRDGMPSETTSTTVLKNEFKRMMRDTRAENMKALKAEQEERRKLEALVRTLKKEQSSGKVNLSQSTTAS